MLADDGEGGVEMLPTAPAPGAPPSRPSTPPLDWGQGAAAAKDPGDVVVGTNPVWNRGPSVPHMPGVVPGGAAASPPGQRVSPVSSPPPAPPV